MSQATFEENVIREHLEKAANMLSDVWLGLYNSPAYAENSPDSTVCIVLDAISLANRIARNAS